MLVLQISAFDLDVKPHKPTEPMTLKLPGPFFRLTPEELEQRDARFKRSQRWGLDLHITSHDTNLEVCGFEYFTLQAFDNTKADIPRLGVRGATQSFRLNGLNVRQLDSDDSNALVADCEINEFNVGLVVRHASFFGAAEPGPVSTDVRQSLITRLRIFVPQTRVNLQGGHFQRVRLVAEKGCETQELSVWEQCEIENLSLDTPVHALTVRGASIERLFLSPTARVRKLLVEAGAVTQVFGATLSTFEDRSMASSRLVMMSARNAHDRDLLASAVYEYESMHRKQSRWPSKIASWAMEYCCGFGYKPGRAIGAAIILWIGMAMAFSVLTLVFDCGMKWDNSQSATFAEVILRSLYFSAITLTTVGFGDTTPNGAIAMFLAAVESSAGIILFALLVFSLSKRFGVD